MLIGLTFLLVLSGCGWGRVSDPLGTFENARIFAAADCAGRLVAVGAALDGAEHGPGQADADAAVWTSEDAKTFQRVPHDESIFGGRGVQMMRSLTRGGPGCVAVGVSEETGDRDAAVWTSSDGTNWSRRRDHVLGGPGHQTMADVISGGPGLVAVGSERIGNESNAAIWFFSDSAAWARVEDAQLAGPAQEGVAAVTARGPAMVAVGRALHGGRGCGVWISSTVAAEVGTTWEPRSAPRFCRALNGIVEVDGTLYAAGTAFADYNHLIDEPAVWVSEDNARSWRRAPDQEVLGVYLGSQANALLKVGDRLIVVGSGQTADTREGRVWSLRTSGPKRVLAPERDGSFGGAGWQQMHDVATFAGRLFVVGFEDTAKPGSWPSNAVVWARDPRCLWPKLNLFCDFQYTFGIELYEPLRVR